MAPRDLPEPAFGLRALLPWHLLSSAAGDVPGWVPPARLAHLHVPELVASLWHRLIAAVREPAQVFDLNGQRVVMVAGIAAVRRQPDGALRVDVWRECDGRLQWVTSAPQTVVLQAMPAGWVWLDLIRDAAECELRRHLCQWGVAFEDTDLRIYARELFAHMRRRLVSHADLRQMRRRVAAALALDADAVRIARRVIDVAPGSGPGRVSAYNLVVRHLEAFRLLEREMPQAIPLYAAFVERPDFPSRGQPAQALREFLRSHEVGRCTWRLVVTAGPRLALPLRDFYAGDTAAAMLDYLRILQALRLRREPPPWLIWSILSRVAHPASRFQDHLRSLQRVAPLFGHAARACVAVRPEPVDDLPQVLEWLGTERPQLDKLQRRAGWPWLVARAREWMALRRREIEAQAQSWSTPFARMPIGAYDMVALQSVRDLWDEARAMHHCVDGFVDRCAAGDTLVVSVRSADEGGRRVATALYERQGQRWKLAQVRGVANRCPPREVETAAMFLAGMLNAPGQWPPEAKVKPPVEVGVPPAGQAPRRMPPNARLLIDVAWYWSPMHAKRLRYYISGTRDRSSWLLWERYYDDNHGRWATAKVIAWSPRHGVREDHAAKAMLAAYWKRDIEDRNLDRYHDLRGCGLLEPIEVEEIASELWPDDEEPLPKAA